MSAPEQQNGSGTEGLDLAAMRASMRCGRSLPVLHLVESDEVFTQRHHTREVVVLCCADVTKPDIDDLGYLDCPGCRDCVRYCPDCVREALRFSAGPSPARVPGGEPDLAS